MTDRNRFQQVLITDLRVTDTANRSGASSELVPAPRGSDIMEGDIKEKIDGLLSLAGLRDDRFNLIYTLDVRAVTGPTAKGKALGFVRAKNPFDPRTISLESVGKDKIDDWPLHDIYKVRAILKKR